MRRMVGAGVLAVLVVCGVAVVAARAGSALDPVKVSPQTIKERLSNDKVRVLEYRSKPGDKEGLHSHPAGLLIVIKGGRFRSTTADGKSKETECKAGDVVWRDALTHTGENVGTTELQVYLVELK